MDDIKQKMYAVKRNANKRIRRKEEIILNQKERLTQQDQAIQQYKRRFETCERKLSQLRLKLSRVNHRAVYWRSRLQEIEAKGSLRNSKLSDKINNLQEEVANLDLENAELEQTVQTLVSCDEIQTFADGKYTDDVRACIYELLSLNVGVRNVTAIIKCVLENIVHRKPVRLPSHGLTCRMILESLVIVQAQLGQELSQADSCLTLQTDGTTKFFEHHATYDVSVSESSADNAKQSYCLGLRHIFSGSADDTLQSLKEILDDIDSVQQEIGDNPLSSKILMKIKNTMSDRHAAETLFNTLLEEYRADVLPTVVENWGELSANPNK